MKKLFAILTILCLCMFVVGCGPKADPAPETTPEATEPADPADPAAPAEEATDPAPAEEGEG